MSNLLVVIWLSFLRFILTFLHFAYSGFEYFDLTWSLFRRKLEDIRFHRLDGQLFVSRIVTKLDKTPSHFVVIVGSDGIDVEDFSNIVIWCLAAKISFISFYDYTGYLKANETIYYKYLIDKRKLDPRCLLFHLNNQKSKNGVIHKICLNILSLEDGKPSIRNLTKNLTTRVISRELKITEINERFISDELFKLVGLPEPELGVIGGLICGTFGFLPWHTRMTEFLQVKSLKGLHVSEFAAILEKYSSCKQRFGK